jgi:hypothetical protein
METGSMRAFKSDDFNALSTAAKGAVKQERLPRN